MGNSGRLMSMNLDKKESKRQRFAQWWYGVAEPYILRYSDFMLKTEFRRKIYIKQKKPASLPKSIIISNQMVNKFVDSIYENPEASGGAKIAVTDCVCQTALGKFKEPRKKDMALLYAADMYTTVTHTGIKEDFEPIETAEEAKKMLWHFHESGLMHNALYCNNSGKWLFVMCNCDNEICVPFRSYMAGRKEELGAGPDIVEYDQAKCIGVEKCGKCIDRCILKACFKGPDGFSRVNLDECLGCELCVTYCKGNARKMVPRKDYKYNKIFNVDNF